VYAILSKILPFAPLRQKFRFLNFWWLFSRFSGRGLEVVLQILKKKQKNHFNFSKNIKKINRQCSVLDFRKLSLSIIKTNQEWDLVLDLERDLSDYEILSEILPFAPLRHEVSDCPVQVHPGDPWHSRDLSWTQTRRCLHLDEGCEHWCR
jgi:hypothetical protein